MKPAFPEITESCNEAVTASTSGRQEYLENLLNEFI